MVDDLRYHCTRHGHTAERASLAGRPLQKTAVGLLALLPRLPVPCSVGEAVAAQSNKLPVCNGGVGPTPHRHHWCKRYQMGSAVKKHSTRQEAFNTSRSIQHVKKHSTRQEAFNTSRSTSRSIQHVKKHSTRQEAFNTSRSKECKATTIQQCQRTNNARAMEWGHSAEILEQTMAWGIGAHCSGSATRYVHGS